MPGKQNGALIDCVEAGSAAGVDARTIRKWTKTDHPNLGVVAGGRLYIRRARLENIIGRPMSEDEAPRVTFVTLGGSLMRMTPEAAASFIAGGAKIDPNDERSRENWARFLEQQQAAEVTS